MERSLNQVESPKVEMCRDKREFSVWVQNSLFTSNKGNLIYNSDKGGCCERSQSGAQRPLLLGTPRTPRVFQTVSVKI